MNPCVPLLTYRSRLRLHSAFLLTPRVENRRRRGPRGLRVLRGRHRGDGFAALPRAAGGLSVGALRRSRKGATNSTTSRSKVQQNT